MEIDLSTFFRQGTDFLHDVTRRLRFAGIKPEDFMIDHVCYRVSTPESYEVWKSALSPERGFSLFHESEVNGRPIAIFKLANPFSAGHQFVDVLELPAPRPGRFYSEGFEHVELVADGHFDKLITRYAHLSFDRSGIQKVHNPELGLRLGDIRIKFHPVSLEKLIESERSGGGI